MKTSAIQDGSLEALPLTSIHPCTVTAVARTSPATVRRYASWNVVRVTAPTPQVDFDLLVEVEGTAVLHGDLQHGGLEPVALSRHRRDDRARGSTPNEPPPSTAGTPRGGSPPWRPSRRNGCGSGGRTCSRPGHVKAGGTVAPRLRSPYVPAPVAVSSKALRRAAAMRSTPPRLKTAKSPSASTVTSPPWTIRP